MPSVRIMETYDLSTQTEKMGIIAIHTPMGSLAERMYPGLCKQYEKFRWSRCDVVMACASQLPADPLQVGVEAGDIAPQDMFNPILYKAVSNDSMNNFLNYMQYQRNYSYSSVDSDGGSESVDAAVGPSVDALNNPPFSTGDSVISGDIDQFAMYYGILSDPQGFRRAMPQAGLQMRGLKPLVYNVISMYGLNAPANTVSGAPNVQGSSNFMASVTGTTYPGYPNASNDARSTLANGTWWPPLRGKSMPMPWCNTKSWSPVGSEDGSVVTLSESDNQWSALQCNVGRMPPVYVGLIIVPPAKLNRLYYRLRVTWTLEFKGLQSTAQTSNWEGLAQLGTQAYGTDYAEQSGLMATTTSMVDTIGTDVDLVMEGAS